MLSTSSSPKLQMLPQPRYCPRDGGESTGNFSASLPKRTTTSKVPFCPVLGDHVPLLLISKAIFAISHFGICHCLRTSSTGDRIQHCCELLPGKLRCQTRSSSSWKGIEPGAGGAALHSGYCLEKNLGCPSGAVRKEDLSQRRKITGAGIILGGRDISIKGGWDGTWEQGSKNPNLHFSQIIL